MFLRARLNGRVLLPLQLHQFLQHQILLPLHFYSDDAARRETSTSPRLFVVQPRLRPDRILRAKLDEALALANSLEEQRDGVANMAMPPSIIVQNPLLSSYGARAGTFFGPGTVDTIKCHLFALESKDEMDGVFVNAILTGVQQRNLERVWEKPVLDRVGLIIDIFHAHAHTREAKLQAELAALSYKKSRLVRVRGPGGRYTFGGAGEAEVVSARGRGSVGRGFISGAGETELQLQRRRILDRRSALLIQIEEIRRTRAQQRVARRRHGGFNNERLATVAIVGYTNAGKSSLVNAVTSSTLYSDSRLFATLDPRIKSCLLPSGRKVLLSDTVGFISDLPVQLVEAFHATLEEVVEADLLVHVIDCTAPNLDEHRHSVLQVLRQIGVSNEKLQDMIEVWNKIDCEDIHERRHSSDDKRFNYSENDDDDEADSRTEQSGEEDDEANSSIEQREEEDDDANSSIEQREEEDDDANSSIEQSSESHMICGSGLGASPCVITKMPLNSPCEPHCKVSAVTRAGLPALLDLIDEKLKVQDEKLKETKTLTEKRFFDRKWRPPAAAEDSPLTRT